MGCQTPRLPLLSGPAARRNSSKEAPEPMDTGEEIKFDDKELRKVAEELIRRGQGT